MRVGPLILKSLPPEGADLSALYMLIRRRCLRMGILAPRIEGVHRAAKRLEKKGSVTIRWSVVGIEGDFIRKAESCSER